MYFKSLWWVFENDIVWTCYLRKTTFSIQKCMILMFLCFSYFLFSASLWTSLSYFNSISLLLLLLLSRFSRARLCATHRWQPTRLPVPGILQARTLEWVAISFSNAWKGQVKVKSLSRIQLLATPWTVAYQAPPSMGFSRQEYRSGVPSPSLHTPST